MSLMTLLFMSMFYACITDCLVKMAYAGICGSDMHFVLHGRHQQRVLSKENPAIMGHEGSGVVVKVGANVDPVMTGLKEGTRVALEPNTFCRNCHECKIGRQNMCEYQVEIPPRDGMMQEYVIWPSYLVHPIPDKLSLLEASQIEPLSTFILSVNRRIPNGLQTGSKVLVLGCGPMGLLATLAVKASGASMVVVTDVNQLRLDHVVKSGADFGFNPATFAPVKNGPADGTNGTLDELDLKLENIKQQAAEVRKLFGGHCPDIVYDCVGFESSVMLGIEALKKDGVYVQIGVGGVATRNAALPLPFFLDHISKGITLLGLVKTAAAAFDEAIHIVADGKIDVKKVVSHIKSLDEFHEAFFDLTASGKSPSKVMFKCDPNAE